MLQVPINGFHRRGVLFQDKPAGLLTQMVNDKERRKKRVNRDAGIYLGP